MAIANIGLGFYNCGFSTVEYNRKIVFGRNSSEASSIYAKVFAFEAHGWGEKPISEIPGDKIFMEVLSSKEKTRRLVQSEMGEPEDIPKAEILSQLSLQRQDEIFDNFQRWSIEIENEPGPEFEKVVSLNLFDPG